MSQVECESSEGLEIQIAECSESLPWKRPERSYRVVLLRNILPEEGHCVMKEGKKVLRVGKVGAGK